MSSYHRRNISSEMVEEEIVEVAVLNAIISTYHTNSQWKITHSFSPTY